MAKAPQVIFLHGPAASGKLTIARELAALTGLALFHNHLTVDLVLSLFPFGSPAFIEQRERIWLELMSRAVTEGTSLIFTFNPERTVSGDFPQTLETRVRAAGGTVRFVEIACAEGEIEKRLGTEVRRDFKKLSSVDFYRQLKREGAFDYPPIPSECRIDSTASPPHESALQIVRALHL